MDGLERKPHKLIREKTLAMPRFVILFDTETEAVSSSNGDTVHILKLGWVCYYQRAYGRHLERTEWQEFRDIDTFWRFVERYTGAKRKIWLIATNLVFDFTVLEGWKYLRKTGYKLKFFHTKGTTTLIKVKRGTCSLLFVDSLNWFREPLAKTGERLGIPKIAIDFETCTLTELSIYCKRDVEIMLAQFKAFVRFLTGNYISRLCYTIGSTAMAAYMFGHYHTDIYIHNNRKAIQLERASYKGGRVECFYLGEKTDENTYIVDVNSLYPFVMSANPFPVRYDTKGAGVSVLADGVGEKGKAVIAHVLINTNEPVYAVRRERTIFPVGRFWTTLTTPEIVYALEHNHIEAVTECVLYEQANIFGTYVDKMYTLRKDFKSAGVEVYDDICKLLLNSLYGKFGQKGEVWSKIGDAPNEPDRVELLFIEGQHRTRQIRYLLGEIFELTGYTECYNSFPAISAHVTAYGRLYLWRLILMAGREHVLYCDTDSLIVDHTGFERLTPMLDDTELGKLKTVEVTPSIHILGLKDYSTGSKTVIKGIRKTAVETQAGVYTQTQWPSFRGVLRSGDADTYVTHTVEKVLDRQYTKGIVTSEGHVLPFLLTECSDVSVPLL